MVQQSKCIQYKYSKHEKDCTLIKSLVPSLNIPQVRRLAPWIHRLNGHHLQRIANNVVANIIGGDFADKSSSGNTLEIQISESDSEASGA